jgi:hypothetical protein
MVRVKIGDKEYGLRLDLDAVEKIQDEFGDMGDAVNKMKKSNVKAIRTLFKIMANSALAFEGKEETVTGEELKKLKIAAMPGISKAFERAIEDGMRSETTGGAEADDEVYDVYLAEIEEKNG